MQKVETLWYVTNFVQSRPWIMKFGGVQKKRARYKSVNF